MSSPFWAPAEGGNRHLDATRKNYSSPCVRKDEELSYLCLEKESLSFINGGKALLGKFAKVIVNKEISGHQYPRCSLAYFSSELDTSSTVSFSLNKASLSTSSLHRPKIAIHS